MNNGTNGKINWGRIGTVIAIIIPMLTAALFIYRDLVTQLGIALQVARDHGEELHLIREEVHEIRGVVLSQTDDRFRRGDWLREKEWIEDVISRHERVHKNLEERLDEMDK